MGAAKAMGGQYKSNRAVVGVGGFGTVDGNKSANNHTTAGGDKCGWRMA